MLFPAGSIGTPTVTKLTTTASIGEFFSSLETASHYAISQAQERMRGGGMEVDRKNMYREKEMAGWEEEWKKTRFFLFFPFSDDDVLSTLQSDQTNVHVCGPFIVGNSRLLVCGLLVIWTLYN